MHHLATNRHHGLQRSQERQVAKELAASRRTVLAALHAALEGFALTPREHEVALLVALGHSNKEVASRLAITVHTARRHTERVLRKLEVGSRAKVAGRLLSIAIANWDSRATA